MTDEQLRNIASEEDFLSDAQPIEDTDFLSDSIHVSDEPFLTKYESTLKPIAEGVGMIGGEILSLPSAAVSGPIGPAIGAGLGYAAGGKAYDMAKLLSDYKRIKEQHPISLEGLKSESIKTANDIMGGSIASPLGSALGNAVSRGTKYSITKGSELMNKPIPWVTEKLSAIPAKSVKTYLDNPEEVAAMMKKNPFQVGSDLQDDFISRKTSEMNRLGEAVDNALDMAVREKGNIPSNEAFNPIINFYQAARDNLKISGDASQAKWDYLNRQARRFEQMRAEYTNGINPRDYNELKKSLYKEAYGDWKNKYAAGENKQASYLMKETLNRFEPRIRPLNDKEAAIFDLENNTRFDTLVTKENMEEKLANNLMNEGTPQAIKERAKQADELLGTNILKTAEIANAAKNMKPDDLFSTFKTGRAPLMGLLGEGISETMGFARGPGLIAGTIAGSPFAYQKAIPALLKGQQMAGEYLPEITRATTKSAFSVAPNIRPFTEEEKKMRALEQLSEDQSW